MVGELLAPWDAQKLAQELSSEAVIMSEVQDGVQHASSTNMEDMSDECIALLCASVGVYGVNRSVFPLMRYRAEFFLMENIPAAHFMADLSSSAEVTQEHVLAALHKTKQLTILGTGQWSRICGVPPLSNVGGLTRVPMLANVPMQLFDRYADMIIDWGEEEAKEVAESTAAATSTVGKADEDTKESTAAVASTSRDMQGYVFHGNPRAASNDFDGADFDS
jgi:hypothetical protein